MTPESHDFGLQLLTAVSTLVVAVAGFYFGTKATQQAATAAKEMRAPQRASDLVGPRPEPPPADAVAGSSPPGPDDAADDDLDDVDADDTTAEPAEGAIPDDDGEAANLGEAAKGGEAAVAQATGPGGGVVLPDGGIPADDAIPGVGDGAPGGVVGEDGSQGDDAGPDGDGDVQDEDAAVDDDVDVDDDAGRP